MRRAVLVLAFVSLLLSACGSSSKNSQPRRTTSSSAATTTTAAVPSTTAPAPETTFPPAPTTSIPTVVKESVYIDSVDPAAHTITVDPMEFLTGPAATTEYHKVNPAATGGPENDYFIVNPTKDHVVLPLDPKATAEVVVVNSAPHANPVPVSQSQLTAYSPLTHAPFWITIERGAVTNVMEQFVP